jgi:hypothetical protein
VSIIDIVLFLVLYKSSFFLDFIFFFSFAVKNWGEKRAKNSSELNRLTRQKGNSTVYNSQHVLDVYSLQKLLGEIQFNNPLYKELIIDYYAS